MDNYQGLKVFVPEIIMYWNFNPDGGAIMNWVWEKGLFHQDKLLGFVYKRPEQCLFYSRWRHWNHQSWIRNWDLISSNLILDFQPLELWERNFWHLSATQSIVLCYCSVNWAKHKHRYPGITCTLAIGGLPLSPPSANSYLRSLFSVCLSCSLALVNATSSHLILFLISLWFHGCVSLWQSWGFTMGGHGNQQSLSSSSCPLRLRIPRPCSSLSFILTFPGNEGMNVRVNEEDWAGGLPSLLSSCPSFLSLSLPPFLPPFETESHAAQASLELTL